MALNICVQSSHGKQVSDVTAEDAIQRFVTNKRAKLDPTNPEHIEGYKYKILRATMGSVDPNRLENYLNGRQSNMRHGAESVMEF